MKIGITGSGRIGAHLAQLLVKAGHDVAISNSRGPESLSDLVVELGPRARAETVDGAARFGDVIFLAIPWRTPEGLPKPELVKGKIIVDAMNPYSASGEVMDLGDSTSSEETLKQLPGARLVKAFNTMFYQDLAKRGRTDLPEPERLAIFLAGDDAEAKRVVSELIRQIGFTPVDTGSLREGGRSQQPGSPIYNNPMTGQQAQERVRSAARQ